MKKNKIQIVLDIIKQSTTKVMSQNNGNNEKSFSSLPKISHENQNQPYLSTKTQIPALINNIHYALIIYLGRTSLPLAPNQQQQSSIINTLQHLLLETYEMVMDIIKRQSPVQDKKRRSDQMSELNKKEAFQGFQGLLELGDKELKKFHLKLIHQIKKLSKQCQEKAEHIKTLNRFILHKEKQLSIEQATTIQMKEKIAILDEEFYQKVCQLEQYETQLQTQRQCTSILQKKLDKAYQKLSQSSQSEMNGQNCCKQVMEIGTQTELSEQISQISFVSRNEPKKIERWSKKSTQPNQSMVKQQPQEEKPQEEKRQRAKTKTMYFVRSQKGPI